MKLRSRKSQIAREVHECNRLKQNESIWFSVSQTSSHSCVICWRNECSALGTYSRDCMQCRTDAAYCSLLIGTRYTLFRPAYEIPGLKTSSSGIANPAENRALAPVQWNRCHVNFLLSSSATAGASAYHSVLNLVNSLDCVCACVYACVVRLYINLSKPTTHTIIITVTHLLLQVQNSLSSGLHPRQLCTANSQSSQMFGLMVFYWWSS